MGRLWRVVEDEDRAEREKSKYTPTVELLSGSYFTDLEIITVEFDLEWDDYWIECSITEDYSAPLDVYQDRESDEEIRGAEKKHKWRALVQRNSMLRK